MALDTAAKRASSISMGDYEVGRHLPSAGGINTQGERQAVAFSYSGIAADEAVIPDYLPRYDRRRRVAAILWG